MSASQIVYDAITRKIYYGLLSTAEPESSVEFMCALDGIEGGIGESASGLPGITPEARAIEDLCGAISRDTAAGFLLSAAGYRITDPDERTTEGTPTEVFRLVLEFKITGKTHFEYRFPETIGGLAGVVLSSERNQGTISEEGCKLTAGEVKTLRQAGLSIVP